MGLQHSGGTEQDGYVQTLGREFSYVTPESAMKSYYIEPSPGKFAFTWPDRLVEFAEAHAMQVDRESHRKSNRGRNVDLNSYSCGDSKPSCERFR